MERIKKEVVFEYDGPTDVAPFKEIASRFIEPDHKIKSRYTAGGKYVEITVIHNKKELIA